MMPSTRDLHDDLRSTPVPTSQPQVPKVVVDNDGPSTTGVWQGGVPPPGHVVRPVKDA